MALYPPRRKLPILGLFLGRERKVDHCPVAWIFKGLLEGLVSVLPDVEAYGNQHGRVVIATG